MFKMHFPKANVQEWAELYSKHYEDSTVRRIRAAASKAGYLTREQLLGIALGRREAEVRRVAGATASHTLRKSLASPSLPASPRLKIEALRLMDGVQWPTRSGGISRTSLEKRSASSIVGLQDIQTPSLGCGSRPTECEAKRDAKMI